MSHTQYAFSIIAILLTLSSVSAKADLGQFRNLECDPRAEYDQSPGLRIRTLADKTISVARGNGYLLKSLGTFEVQVVKQADGKVKIAGDGLTILLSAVSHRKAQPAELSLETDTEEIKSEKVFCILN